MRLKPFGGRLLELVVAVGPRGSRVTLTFEEGPFSKWVRSCFRSPSKLEPKIRVRAA